MGEGIEPDDMPVWPRSALWGGVASDVLQPRRDVLRGRLGDVGASHHAALAECGAPHLELRLHQEHAPGARLGKGKRRRQRELQRDEAQVRGDRLHGTPAQMRARQVAGVHPLDQGDARVGGECGVHLAMADIDCDDMRRAALQQHLREAARRSAEVEHRQSGRIEAEGVEPGGKLQRRARNISRRRVVDRNRRLRADHPRRPRLGRRRRA